MSLIVQLSKPTECATSKVNPTVNSGLWGTLMCQCRFSSCSKTLVGDADNGGGCDVEVDGVWEISVPSTQF